jgi:hypothetical protein
MRYCFLPKSHTVLLAQYYQVPVVVEIYRYIPAYHIQRGNTSIVGNPLSTRLVKSGKQQFEDKIVKKKYSFINK